MENLKDYGLVLEMENLNKYTSFHIGGPAKALVFPRDEKSLIEIIKICKSENLKYIVLGNCTNVLVSDKGYDGVVIMLKNVLDNIDINEDTIEAGAGATLRSVANTALSYSLTGFEFAHGIPGSVGGGVIMNAGAYDGELKDIVESVRVLDDNLNIIELSNEDMNFSYRTSVAQENNYIVLSAKFKLVKGDSIKIKEKMDDLWNRRVTKQPLEWPSAGSTFRRPKGYFAGKLIDDSGLRGFTHGNASISDKHCGFVINKGGATAREVRETIETVQKIVKDNYGVELKREVKYIGDN
ncbi:UDP-N-acetylmuramate dehydrogenase [Peptoniphilus stercorisuis]|uniref:UDP-N-acetylenolpyruvoylglucosamine reductase n=1 Tax=Peptoniphilus stercorisuis TaxID=1436965 RepID=A0ABS4KE02_9FIRM|nr:UDP-N-acetylmuramate dehydrogenase [Peptoniphilus stercorisuis]MBP2025994.1 UDP-N-acetylmuramate dehydrogenase [Peptoniphilus stercorisuis]